VEFKGGFFGKAGGEGVHGAGLEIRRGRQCVPLKEAYLGEVGMVSG
jgi:hypothetical protein